jgi:hypothetical protein
MTQHISVNDTLDRINELAGRPVEVEGVLDSSFDSCLGRSEYWLLHYPKAERRTAATAPQSTKPSRLWLAFGDGSLRPNPVALTRWDGKRVRVLGIARPARTTSEDLFSGNSAYYAHVEVFSIQRLASEQRKWET